jgi:hypothetical protein
VSADTLSVLRQSSGRTLTDEEGRREVVRLQPPATPARIAEIERDIGFALPRELGSVLAFSAGIDLEISDSLDFASIGRCSHENLFGVVMTIVGDGAGNFWIVELRADATTLGPVWFLCHDAPVLVYQSPDLGTFLVDYLNYFEDSESGPLSSVVRQAVRAVWEQTLDVPRDELLSSPDPVLRDFANRLESNWFVRDLRRAKTGDGMPIGRFGPKTPLARADREFVFAYGSRTRFERLRTWLTGH